ncbi:MAG: DUF3226 domain-containing protein [Phycisphaerae bacterium]|nr:DUF3226 domain-containing protein [Phycisphaerae bacterium]
MKISISTGDLYVEGQDDEHAIKQLLARHQIDIHDDDCPLRVHCKGSDASVIDAIAVAIKASGTSPVGFILDTDAFGDGRRLTRVDRWKSIRSRLEAGGVVLPTPAEPVNDELPESGFIGLSAKYERAVGVWLMPDNRADYGRIEDLLVTLVPEADELFDLAKRSTSEAISICKNRPKAMAIIQPKDETKGQLHSWLAWQAEPGLSYGHALRRKYFEHDSIVARAFIDWFRRLYEAH